MKMVCQPPPDKPATATRSGVVECDSHGSIAAADADGNLTGWVGDPGARYYLRSSAKPLQALGIVTTGAYEALGMTPKELAVCCASHSGSAEHQETVLSVLTKAGLSESALQCGTHMPGDTEARAALVESGQEPTPVHNNCSGKHAGKLATAVHIGAPVASYLDAKHPVQRLIVANIALLADLKPADIHIGVDGCGSPVHCLPLSNMAIAFARAAAARNMPDDMAKAAATIRAAIGEHPHMVSSHGSFNTDLIAAFDGDAYAKAGAEALFCAGFSASGQAVAVKVSAGGTRMMSPIMMRTLELLGLPAKALNRLDRYRRTPITNCRREEVGWIEPTDFAL